MLKASVVVTVLVPKKYLFFITVITAVLVLLGIGIVYRADKYTLYSADRSFHAEFMATAAQRAQGLSGRDNLANDSAMIFTFDDVGQRCFWMKDMKFSIDMVWLDSSKHVVAIEKNVSPQTYPHSFCHDNTKYVIEFAANTTESMHLVTDDTFDF